jgi:DNA-binding winged helix-turn-helix (wHTH) protein
LVYTLSDTYRLLRFGVFELNLDLEKLHKNGTPLKLPPQPFKLLTLLASRSGQVVTRDEIQEQLWGNDTFIDFDQGVNKCIKQIRTALSDNPDNPLYLETIPRRGYRFLAPVRTKLVPAPPPQVKEASSGLIAKVAEQVRQRVEAATQAPTPSSPPTTETSAGLPMPQAASIPLEFNATASACCPDSPPSAKDGADVSGVLGVSALSHGIKSILKAALASFRAFHKG